MTDPSSQDRAAERINRQFARDTSQLAEIRRFVQTWFQRYDLPRSMADDFELAVSELTTNAIQYGMGALVDVCLEVDVVLVSAVVAAASAAAANVGRVDSWSIAPPAALHGRGLGIVAAIMDVVEFSGDDGRAVFRCGRRR